MKPEWCPEEVWEKADEISSHPGHMDEMAELIARALLEAEQRGRKAGMEENRRLREIIGRCAESAGAFVAQDATIEFMELLPKEIAAIRAKANEVRP